MATAVRAHVWVGGKVQGVYFRAATREAAQRQGVAGWVRNLPDGRVEAVFEGPPAAVQRLIDWCRQGPPAAVVEQLRVAYELPEGLTHFEVLRS
ncbi:acylphosphatase [Gloeobacter violaceus]|uniref:Acylphosphatase n=1 Tax=Gloeobacter violaceus (strain ATCC 29082 / PCC 7421) TaxID=251221 RepID=ACYP_GLOVI|nr:acylphosphatase [Gloeobacter violaceus]Q7NE87.1 RecName: Full=Acylphosphatase; AltName: Full=Acylphosphate phosphohydrolase [Gloeobacter violaceus PCC 7421]BAC91934.1 gsr3993 [Gloeobacter violaceus PCC 7421]